MKETTWKTAITKVEPNKLLLRGYPIDQLIGNISLPQAILLAIKGKLPSENEAKMIDAIMVSSIDHGVTPPSCLAARTITSAGASLNAALAGGVLAISKNHGGAIEDSMNLFHMAVKRRRELRIKAEEAAAIVIKEYRTSGKRLPGYGHRFHTEDPRTVRLFHIAHELAIAGEYVEMAKAIEGGIKEIICKVLPINVDGAIASLLCEMDFPVKLANGFFIMARMPGLIAHIYEEQTRMKPMRHINSKAHEYDGVSERKLKR
ncbi:citryl-CoA lyase [Thermodesulfobacteriota bacterium]